MNIKDRAKLVVANEIQALQRMSLLIDKDFDKAVKIIKSSKGRVVVMGIGKSGIIAKKIAATFSSTGTPAFFVHPAEAFHGDLGMILSGDVILIISNSGETEEIIKIIPYLKHQACRIVTLTGNMMSTLAKVSSAALNVGVEEEACNLNLAPTSSTTCALVMGDALAVTLSSEKKFMPEDFAKFHPGGNLGRKILARVQDAMIKDNLPICSETDTFKTVVATITAKRLGVSLIMRSDNLVGIITDGDIRRAFDRFKDLRDVTASDFMSKYPRTIEPETMLLKAEELMKKNKISSLVVLDKEAKLMGLLQLF